MAQFRYIAKSRTGERQEGLLEAPDKRALLVLLGRKGLVPISVSDTPAAKPAPAEPAEKSKPAAKPPAKPKEVKPAEAHPARLWIQLAAGRDRSALQFDWKRLSRQSKGKIDKLGPFVAKWGQTNRLLVGPFKDEAARRAMVKTLEDAGLDTLPHSSSAGAVVEPLK